MLKTFVAAAAIGALLVAIPVAAQQQPSPVSPSPIKRTLIGKTEVPGGTHEVISATVEIAAGFKAGRHFHPGVVQATVIDGQFWLAQDGLAEKTFAAGESFEIPMKMVHNEGAVGDKPAKLFAVYIVEKGQPLVQPAQ